MRPFVRCWLFGLLPALLSAQAGFAQDSPEATILAKRFPTARYGALLAQPVVSSPAAQHRTYRLTAPDGRWRWPATVRTTVLPTTGRVLNVFADAVRPLPSFSVSPIAAPDPALGAQLTERYLLNRLPMGTRRAATIRERLPVWYVADSLTGTEQPGWLLVWGHPDSRIGAWEVLLDEATGQPVRSARDLLCYHHAAGRAARATSGPPRDTTAVALVFRPDPLTTARRPYGGAYLDSLDADRPVLTRQRVADTLWLTFAADSFRLRNAGFRLAEFDPPVRSVVAASTVAGLQFTRSAAGFEQVNALFHLTRARQYLLSLGFGGLHPAPIRVDASGLSGADQSRFSPIDTTLSFGEGGVDDAEDADVLTHEYLHALAFAAAPGTNIGIERRTLDEANADYWAAVQSARTGPPTTFGHDQVFNWDGHNEFWGGRWVISSKLYPHDLVGSMYLDADVWSATLWQIRAALPPTVADRLFLQHLYAYAPNLTMPQAAALFLQADTLLYGAIHAATIFQRFDARHILGNHVVVGEEEPEIPATNQPQVSATDAFAQGGAARVRAAPGTGLHLTNVLGIPIWTGRVGAAGTAEISARDLRPGSYYLRIEAGGAPFGRRSTVRLVRW